MIAFFHFSIVISTLHYQPLLKARSATGVTHKR
jgi:hypothetical protein